MAHNLSMKDGKAEMAYTGATPWHSLGTRVDGLQTAQDMLRHAGLLWTVSTRPVAFPVEEGGAPSKWAQGVRVIVRDDTHADLGVASARYQPIQNTQAGEMMDALVTEGGAHVEVAGALGQGERAWMLAHVPSDFDVVKGDRVSTYVLLAWGHDGKHGLAGKLTPVRVVCRNTLNMALGAKWSKTADVFIRHSGTVKLRIEEAQRALGLVRKQVQETSEAFRALAQRQLSAAEASGYFSALFSAPAAMEQAKRTDAEQESVERWIAQQEQLAQLYVNGVGANLAPDTAWNAYNAVTEYVDHVYPVLQSGKLSATRQESALFGSYAGIKREALQSALALVK